MIGAHGHGQWVDDNIFGGDTRLGGALFGGGGDTVIIHTQANHGRAVFFGQGDKTAFRDFSYPLMELIKAFPSYNLRAASRAFELAVSMHKGTSTSEERTAKLGIPAKNIVIDPLAMTMGADHD